MIRPGDSGPEVTAWQHKLREFGFTWLHITGRHTGRSVTDTRAFQRGMGIEVDGVVGPETEREMERSLEIRRGYRDDPRKDAPIDDGLIVTPPQIGRRFMPIFAAIVLLAIVGFIVWRVVS